MSDSESKSGEKKLVTIKNATDLQRMRLEKLMKNPDKPVVIPDRPKSKALAAPPDFVRNVMGSSAGAGSGEFHVYRHLRRKEYARQKFIQEKSEKEKLDEEYHRKIEQNRQEAEARTAKKRAKRLKKKKNAKLKCKKPQTQNKLNVSSDSDSSSDNDDNEGNEEKTQKNHGEAKQYNQSDSNDGEVSIDNKSDEINNEKTNEAESIDSTLKNDASDEIGNDLTHLTESEKNTGN